MSTQFTLHFESLFQGILHWHQLDVLWEKVEAYSEVWHACMTGDSLPDKPLDPNASCQFIDELYVRLHQAHDYDYCGVVYADNPEQPSMIKIYNPHNIGNSCGCCAQRIWPRWILSKIKPEPLAATPDV